MKFNNLKMIQQLAILADLAGLIDPRRQQHITVPYIFPDESAEIDISKHGLNTTIRFLRLSTSFTVDHPSEKAHHSRIRLVQPHGSKDVVNFFDVPSVPDYSEQIGLGKYGIGNNITLKAGDVGKALREAIKFLKSFEKVLKTESKISEVFQLMLDELPKAELIDEDFLDRLYVTRGMSLLMGTLQNYIYSTGVVNESHPFFCDNDPDYTPPEYTVGIQSGGIIEIYHTASFKNPKAYILSINLADGGDDMVEVFCTQRDVETPTRLGAFVPQYNGDIKEFIEDIKDKVKDIVLGSAQRDNLVNKLTYLLDRIDAVECDLTECTANTKDYFDEE